MRVLTKDIINNGKILKVYYDGKNSEGKIYKNADYEFKGSIYNIQTLDGVCIRRIKVN